MYSYLVGFEIWLRSAYLG